MNIKFSSQLSQDMQTFVIELEENAGVTVEVEVKPSNTSCGSYHENLSCEIQSDFAKIITPREDFFPNESVFHEALHIKRFLIQGIPQIIDNPECDGWYPELGSKLLILDNQLEHSVIVPIELQKFPQRMGYWSKIMQRIFQEDLPKIQNMLEMKRDSLIHWAFIEIVMPNDPVRKVAYKFLTKNGLIRYAENFVNEIKPFISSKEKLFPIVLNHLELDLNIAEFDYL